MQAVVAHERPGGGAIFLVGLWCFATMILWGFAFYHAPGATPEWLRRAQSACFGTDESGLPDTYGWTVLIIAPLSMLLAVVTTFRGEIYAGLSALLHRRRWQILFAGVAALVALETIWVGARIRTGLAVLNTSYESTDTGRLPSEYPKLAKMAPEFNLIDQTAKHVSLVDLRGKPVIVSFFFAHCHAVCPVIIKTLQQASQQLPKEQVTFLLITLDPWRDTPGDLPALSKAWDFRGDYHILSGPVDDVVAAIKHFEVPTQRSSQDGEIVHPPIVYVISSSGQITYAFNNPPVAWLVDAISKLQS